MELKFYFTMDKFNLHAPYPLRGDQFTATEQICESINDGNPYQTLLGVTGSGKTFTMANIIARLNRPTLVISHNKTLAAQLCSEFRDFFPENAVEYFVSYYDYYRPEAYISSSDLYIEKDCSINSEIDRLRHAATQALLDRRDVIITASVSCIYGLGAPEDYKASSILFRVGKSIKREFILEKLVQMQYTYNKMILERGMFNFKGENLEIFPANGEEPLKISFWGDEIESIKRFDHLTGEMLEKLKFITIYPAKHFVTPVEKMEKAMDSIRQEIDERLEYYREKNKILEPERLKQRTEYDLTMMRETGYCRGIENYSRHMTGRKAGEPPYTLLDYFPDDYLIFIDESHVTIPQLKAMNRGDRARKDSLVTFGFRLPSAYDNRPLTIEEFEAKANQVLYISATPSKYEKDKSAVIAEQIIRPTGLPDPEIIVKKTENCIDDVMRETAKRAEKNERVLVTALTKKMAEELADYMSLNGVKAQYLHSDIKTIDRIKLIQSLREGEFDCIIGVNLLREGLDIPEVSLVCILDADKEGFLRSETSLIQTIGRAARNISGAVIMYADEVTESMQNAIDETNRRRKKQIKYNKENNIVPETVRKAIRDVLDEFSIGKSINATDDEEDINNVSEEAILLKISYLEKEMKKSAEKFEFEKAAAFRDEMFKLKKELKNRENTVFDLPLK